QWDEWTTSAQTKVLVGDFNGDGKDDVMKADVFPNGSQGTNGLWVGISTGSSFVTTRWADWVTSGQTKLLAGDFDDDGRCDVMKFDVLPDGSLGRNGLWVGLSEGSRFRTHDWGEWDTCGTMKVLAGDFGGDAACDVMKFDTFANPGNFGLWVGISTPYEWRPNTAVGRNLAVVGIREALGGYQPVAEHDPRHYVVIDGGRKVARTNSRFASTWAPGFFEEKKDEELPLSRRFGVTAVPYPNRREGHFGAAMVREGNGDRVEIMLDYDAESVVLYLAEGNCDFAVRVRRYQGGDTWGAPVLLQSGVLGRGPKWLALGWMHEKDLMLVELRNRPE
ncbi:MAG TPA: hypothetical protein VK081_06105, partial [Planctomycetota bacterium]|nr:hypothetical protein [Planctomycetota bacterium]